MSIIPYFMTGEGRQEVHDARATVEDLKAKDHLSHRRTRNLDEARRVTRRDLYEKLASLVLVAGVGATVVGFTTPGEESKQKLVIPVKVGEDPSTQEKKPDLETVVAEGGEAESVEKGDTESIGREIRVQNVTKALEKEKNELFNRKGAVSLRFEGEYAEEEARRISEIFTRCMQRIGQDVSIDKALQSTTVQCFCVDDMQLALAQVALQFPGKINDITRTPHADAFTLSIIIAEGEGNTITQSRHLTFLSRQIFDSEARALGTLDHESGHIQLSMGGLLYASREEHETKAYEAGIARLTSMAERLHKSDKEEDVQLAEELHATIIPLHEWRLNSWKN